MSVSLRLYKQTQLEVKYRKFLHHSFQRSKQYTAVLATQCNPFRSSGGDNKNHARA